MAVPEAEAETEALVTSLPTVAAERETVMPETLPEVSYSEASAAIPNKIESAAVTLSNPEGGPGDVTIQTANMYTGNYLCIKALGTKNDWIYTVSFTVRNKGTVATPSDLVDDWETRTYNRYGNEQWPLEFNVFVRNTNEAELVTVSVTAEKDEQFVDYGNTSLTIWLVNQASLPAATVADIMQDTSTVFAKELSDYQRIYLPMNLLEGREITSLRFELVDGSGQPVGKSTDTLSVNTESVTDLRYMSIVGDSISLEVQCVSGMVFFDHRLADGSYTLRLLSGDQVLAEKAGVQIDSTPTVEIYYGGETGVTVGSKQLSCLGELTGIDPSQITMNLTTLDGTVICAADGYRVNFAYGSGISANWYFTLPEAAEYGEGYRVVPTGSASVQVTHNSPIYAQESRILGIRADSNYYVSCVVSTSGFEPMSICRAELYEDGYNWYSLGDPIGTAVGYTDANGEISLEFRDASGNLIQPQGSLYDIYYGYVRLTMDNMEWGNSLNMEICDVRATEAADTMLSLAGENSFPLLATDAWCMGSLYEDGHAAVSVTLMLDNTDEATQTVYQNPSGFALGIRPLMGGTETVVEVSNPDSRLDGDTLRLYLDFSLENEAAGNRLICLYYNGLPVTDAKNGKLLFEAMGNELLTLDDRPQEDGSSSVSISGIDFRNGLHVSNCSEQSLQVQLYHGMDSKPAAVLTADRYGALYSFAEGQFDPSIRYSYVCLDDEGQVICANSSERYLISMDKMFTLPVKTYTATVQQPAAGGSLSLLCPYGWAEEGKADVLSEIYVLAQPAEGYVLKPGSIQVNGQPIEGRSFLITADSVVTAEFTPKPADTYRISIINDYPEHGVLNTSVNRAAAGEKVYFKGIPASGYAWQYLDVYYYDANGRRVRISYQTDQNGFYFVMPDAAVTIYTTWKESGIQLTFTLNCGSNSLCEQFVCMDGAGTQVSRVQPNDIYYMVFPTEANDGKYSYTLKNVYSWYFDPQTYQNTMVDITPVEEQPGHYMMVVGDYPNAIMTINAVYETDCPNDIQLGYDDGYSISASAVAAKPGEKVYVYVNVQKGYEITACRMQVEDENGTVSTKTLQQDDGGFYFIMPEQAPFIWCDCREAGMTTAMVVVNNQNSHPLSDQISLKNADGETTSRFTEGSPVFISLPLEAQVDGVSYTFDKISAIYRVKGTSNWNSLEVEKLPSGKGLYWIEQIPTNADILHIYVNYLSDQRFMVTVQNTAGNPVVIAEPDAAEVGGEVCLSVPDPVQGLRLSLEDTEVFYTNNGRRNRVGVNKNSEGNLYFTMPEGDVTVIPAFEAADRIYYNFHVNNTWNSEIINEVKLTNVSAPERNWFRPGDTMQLSLPETITTTEDSYTFVSASADYYDDTYQRWMTIDVHPVEGQPGVYQIDSLPAMENYMQIILVYRSGKTYSITAVQRETGTLTAEITEAHAGDTVTMTVVNAPGWAAYSARINYNGMWDYYDIAEDNTLTFIMPESDVTVTLSSNQCYYQVIYDSKQDNGYIQADDGGVTFGTEIHIELVPYQGMEVKSVKVIRVDDLTEVTLVPQTTENAYQFTMPACDVVLQAEFGPFSGEAAGGTVTDEASLQAALGSTVEYRNYSCMCAYLQQDLYLQAPLVIEGCSVELYTQGYTIFYQGDGAAICVSGEDASLHMSGNSWTDGAVDTLVTAGDGISVSDGASLTIQDGHYVSQNGAALVVEDDECYASVSYACLSSMRVPEGYSVSDNPTLYVTLASAGTTGYVAEYTIAPTAGRELMFERVETMDGLGYTGSEHMHLVNQNQTYVYSAVVPVQVKVDPGYELYTSLDWLDWDEETRIATILYGSWYGVSCYEKGSGLFNSVSFSNEETQWGFNLNRSIEVDNAILVMTMYDEQGQMVSKQRIICNEYNRNSAKYLTNPGVPAGRYLIEGVLEYDGHRMMLGSRYIEVGDSISYFVYANSSLTLDAESRKVTVQFPTLSIAEIPEGLTLRLVEIDDMDGKTVRQVLGESTDYRIRYYDIYSNIVTEGQNVITELVFNLHITEPLTEGMRVKYVLTADDVDLQPESDSQMYIYSGKCLTTGSYDPNGGDWVGKAEGFEAGTYTLQWTDMYGNRTDLTMVVSADGTGRFNLPAYKFSNYGNTSIYYQGSNICTLNYDSREREFSETTCSAVQVDMDGVYYVGYNGLSDLRVLDRVTYARSYTAGPDRIHVQLSEPVTGSVQTYYQNYRTIYCSDVVNLNDSDSFDFCINNPVMGFNIEMSASLSGKSYCYCNAFYYVDFPILGIDEEYQVYADADGFTVYPISFTAEQLASLRLFCTTENGETELQYTMTNDGGCLVDTAGLANGTYHLSAYWGEQQTVIVGDWAFVIGGQPETESSVRMGVLDPVTENGVTRLPIHFLAKGENDIVDLTVFSYRYDHYNGNGELTKVLTISDVQEGDVLDGGALNLNGDYVLVFHLADGTMLYSYRYHFGSKMYTVSLFMEGTTETLTVKEGGSLTLPENPNLTGYFFDGWYLNGEAVTELTDVQENLTVEGRFTPRKYLVRFCYADGTLIEEQNVNYGELPVYPVSKLVIPEGMDFIGWSNQKPITGSIVIVPEFKDLSFTVRLYLNGGTMMEGEPVSWKLQSSSNLYDLEIKDPVREGYHFAGWYLDPGYSEELNGWNCIVAQETVLYAKWTEAGKLITMADDNIMMQEQYIWESVRTLEKTEGDYVTLRLYTNDQSRITEVRCTGKSGTEYPFSFWEGSDCWFVSLLMPGEDVAVSTTCVENKGSISLSVSGGTLDTVELYCNDPWVYRYDNNVDEAVTFDALPMGTYYLYGYQENATVLCECFELTEDHKEQVLTCKVPETYEVSGTLSCSRDMPEFVQIQLYGQDGYQVWSTVDENGRFVFGAVAAGAYEAYAYYTTATGGSCYAILSNNLTVSANTENLKLTLTRGMDVEVTLTGAEKLGNYATLVLEKQSGEYWYYVTSTLCSSDPGTKYLFNEVITEPGKYRISINSIYEGYYWGDVRFASEPVTFTVDALDGEQKTVSVGYTKPAAEIENLSGSVTLNRSEAYRGELVDLSVNYTLTEGVGAPIFTLELPEGITAYQDKVTLQAAEASEGATLKTTLTVSAEAASGSLSIPVYVTMGETTQLFGNVLLQVADLTLSAPAEVGYGETFTVSGEAAEGSTITILDAKTGRTLATAAVKGRYYSAQLALQEDTVLVAQNGTIRSDYQTVKINNEPITVESVTIGGESLQYNPVRGSYITWQWVGMDLRGFDMSAAVEFSAAWRINSVKLCFCGLEREATYDNTKESWSALFLNGQWGGSGLKELTAVITTINGETITLTVCTINLLIDPSGIVTDSEGNPLSGVTVICQVWDETAEAWVNFDAASYGQVNPQITDSEGRYGWMVPEGEYRILASKAGYENYDSLKDPDFSMNGKTTIVIPPARDDVDFAMTEQAKEYSILPTVSDHAVITVAETAKNGDQVTVTAALDEGYGMSEMKVVGVTSGTVYGTTDGESLSFTMPKENVRLESAQYVLNAGSIAPTVVLESGMIIGSNFAQSTSSLKLLIVTYTAQHQMLNSRMKTVTTDLSGGFETELGDVDASNQVKVFVLDSLKNVPVMECVK